MPTYKAYYLKFALTNRYSYRVEFTRPFTAVDRAINKEPILLGMLLLADLRITIDCAEASFKFKQALEIKVRKVSAKAFAL